MPTVLNFLYTLSNFNVFILLSCTFIIFSIFSIVILKHFIPIKLQYKDNQAIGNVSAVIGLIYGVLVGLTALYLFNNNSYTSDAVQREANSAANIYRQSKWLTDPERSNIQEFVKSYITNVIEVEWPAMERGNDQNQTGDFIIDNISDQLYLESKNPGSNSNISQSLIQEVKLLYDARQQRINMSNAQLGPEIWTVILIGTLLTIGVNFLSKMRFKLHLTSICAVGLMASSMIFLLITLDRPFQGEFIIEPDAMKSVLNFIQKSSESFEKK